MNILEHAKEIADLIKKYNDQELYEKIVNLREELLTLREQNLTMQERIKFLEDSQRIATTLKRLGNYYVTEEDPKGENNIYCLTCWDYDRKLVNLIKRPNNIIHCNICHSRKKSS